MSDLITSHNDAARHAARRAARKASIIASPAMMQAACRRYTSDHVTACLNRLFTIVEKHPDIFEEELGDVDLCPVNYEEAVLAHFDISKVFDDDDMENAFNAIGYAEDAFDEIRRKMKGVAYEKYSAQAIAKKAITRTVWARSVEEAVALLAEDYPDEPYTTDEIDAEGAEWTEWYVENHVLSKEMQLTSLINQHIVDMLTTMADNNASNWKDVAEAVYVDTDDFQSEIFEWYDVEYSFGQALLNNGEIVFEFLGFTVWGRQCTGQAIYLDGVVEKIVRDLPDWHDVWKIKE